MGMLILAAFAAVFLLGLIQWARSGAVLWDILRLSRNNPAGAAASGEKNEKQEARSAKALRDMESMMDRLLRSSFKILGVLALAVWFFVVASVVIDMLGAGYWLDNLSFQASRIWGTPFRSSSRPTNMRQRSTLNSLGSGLRR